MRRAPGAVYEDARPGLAMVDPRSRPCLEAAFVLYRQILAQVVAADHNVFAGRLSVPRWQRLATAGRVVVTGVAKTCRARLQTRTVARPVRRSGASTQPCHRSVAPYRSAAPSGGAPYRSAAAGGAQHGAGPHPRGAGEQHQREPEEQVLDRRPDEAAVAEERDPRGAEDRGGVVADDAAPGQPAVA